MQADPYLASMAGAGGEDGAGDIAATGRPIDATPPAFASPPPLPPLPATAYLAQAAAATLHQVGQLPVVDGMVPVMGQYGLYFQVRERERNKETRQTRRGR